MDSLARTSSALALAALLVLACDTGMGVFEPEDSNSPQLPSERTVLWEAGMEIGNLSEWTEPGGSDAGGGEFNSSGGDAYASKDVAHSGDWSAALLLPEGSGGTRLFRWRESEEQRAAYYSAWFYFPQRYEPAVWWNIFQFKSKLSESVNDPFWVLTVENREDGSMYLTLGEWQTDRWFSQDVLDLPVGAWVHIECYLRQSADADGHLACWQDDELLWDLDGITTHYPGSWNQWSVNNYTDAVGPTPAIIYVDDVSITAPSHERAHALR